MKDLSKDDSLEYLISATLARLDLKGENQKISHAMAIVREAFRHNRNGKLPTPSALFSHSAQFSNQ